MSDAAQPRGKGTGPDEYAVRIIPRDFMGRTVDDWHATVTRISDGKELVFIARWRWFLRWRVRPSRLRRLFARQDRLERKMAQVYEYTVSAEHGKEQR